ncbi:MAG: M48 family metalloprotease [Desulfobacterales bacterium]|nr:M48 family metalloprotease [Desulfobacterales bacterium]
MPYNARKPGAPGAMSRREFLLLTSLAAAGAAAGCAANPVTGKSQLMLVSEEDEIRVDKQNSPHQFSSDYGELQDKALNRYIQRVGKEMTGRTHRPRMPYSFHGVNATYVNAYAFPGGSIACTRGILLSLKNEAELAALLGHELGHVNARHTARQMSKGMLVQTLVSGLAIAAGTQGEAYGKLAGTLGMAGAGALLASYSRDNEREADALGMEYMVRSGYGTPGFVGLMDMLNSMSKHKPGYADLLFSTHPMSDERHGTAVKTAKTEYANSASLPLHKDRYMDNIARLRAMEGPIKNMQKGDQALAQKKYADAERFFGSALKKAPNDYAGLLMLAKCWMIREKWSKGLRYAKKAQKVYPGEAQSYLLTGYMNLLTKKYDHAYRDFTRNGKLLPGNPTVTFFKGYTLEAMQKREKAADNYHQYLLVVKEGNYAQHAYQRLVDWGYIEP